MMILSNLQLQTNFKERIMEFTQQAQPHQEKGPRLIV